MQWSRRGRGSRRTARANKPRKKPRFHPYRSALEKRMAALLSDEYTYEPKYGKLKYNVSHVYNPDFVHPDALDIIIEVKGYFRTSAEAAKYVHVKSNNPDKEVIFLFFNANKKCHPNCRPRKDGTVMTIYEWCIKHEFLFYEEKAIPKTLLEGKTSPAWIALERKRFGYDT